VVIWLWKHASNVNFNNFFCKWTTKCRL